MDNVIKVYMKFPWRFYSGPYHKSMIENPPKDIDFVNYKEKKIKREIVKSNKNFENLRKIKNILRKILSLLKIPNLTYVFLFLLLGEFFRMPPTFTKFYSIP